MPMSTGRQLTELRAHITALEMVLEILLVDHLGTTDDPADTGNLIIKSAFESEESVRENAGDDPQGLKAALLMKVTEKIAALIDRSVKRVIEQKKDRGSSSQ